MAEVRIPGYEEGSDLGGEPANWLIYDTETKERRYELNPNYVPPPDPTELELAERDVWNAKQKLANAEAHLALIIKENQ